MRIGTTAHSGGGIRVATTAHASWFDWLTLPTVNVAGTYWYGVTGAVAAAGTVYAVAVTVDKPDPSAAQIRDGLDGNGDAASGTGSQVTPGDFDFAITGANLTDTPDHHIHVVGWDGAAYTDVVRLRNKILFIDDPTFFNPGAVLAISAQGEVSAQVEEGAWGQVTSPGFAVGLTASVSPAFALGTKTTAVYSPALFLEDMHAAETSTVLILLLTLTHPDWAEPVRLSTDPTGRLSATTTDVLYGTISNGISYFFLPLKITLPSQTEEGPLKMRVVLDNVSRDLIAQLRSLSSPPSVDVELVATAQPNVVLASWPQFLLVNVQYDALTISGDLVLEMLVHEPFPAGTFTPSEFAGLF
jgi:hypothetical protein